MKINPRLNAYVRYTDTGLLIPGSVVWRKKAPSGRNWKQISGNICCTTSTTTSTSTSTTTTTTPAP